MVIALSVAGFCVLIGVAMCAYPGGHEWDRTTRGHDFWRNYICDLARSTALDGEPNTTSAPIAQVALVALLAGGAAFWWALPALFTRPESRLAGAVRTLGALSLAGVLGVALLPADRFGALHPIAMALSGGPGQAAAIVAVVALDARERNRVLGQASSRRSRAAWISGCTRCSSRVAIRARSCRSSSGSR